MTDIRINLNQKEVNLLYELLHHCDEHEEWMKDVLENGELFTKILSKVYKKVNYDD